MRKVAGVLLAAAMVLPVGLVAAPAGAATLLTCTTLTGTAKWTPPVSPTVKATHNVVATGKISGCTGTKGITSGTFTFNSKGTTKENCAVLISSKAASTASSSIKWNNGKTSVSAKLTLTPIATATIKISGKVSSGTQFVGKTANLTSLFIPVGGGCLTKGKSLTTATTTLKKGTKVTIG